MSDILNRVQVAFQAAFGTDPAEVCPAAGPDQIDGWDSLGHAVLATQLEQTFGLSLDIDDIMEMENVGAIVRVVGRKLAASGQRAA